MRKILVPVLAIVLASAYWQLYLAWLGVVLGWERPDALMGLFESGRTNARLWLLAQQIAAVVPAAIPISLAVCHLARHRTWLLGLVVSALSLTPHVVEYLRAPDLPPIDGYALFHMLLACALILGLVPVFSHLLSRLPYPNSGERRRDK